MNTQNKNWKPVFLTMVSGQTVSLLGSSAVQFALIWWLASATGSPMVMALSGLMAFLPQMLLGPFVGVWIDRLKRKHVVIAADMLMGLLALVFAACFLAGEPPYWSAYLVLGARSVGNVFHTPAIQSIVPLLVPKEELIKANGWSQFMQSGAFMLGPVIGAAMYAALPMSVILLTDFIGAAVASICIAVIKIPELPVKETEAVHFWNELKEGVRVLLKDKVLFSVTMTTAACMIFFLPLSSYYPLMASSYFKVSAVYGSIVEVGYAAGMMLTALVLSGFGNTKRKIMMIHAGLFGIGLTSLICGILPPSMGAFWIFAVVCTLMGASGNLYGIPFMAYIQEDVPPQAQGGVFSLIGSLMSAAMPLGLLFSGPFAERNGVATWFFITGIAIMIFIMANLLYMRFLKR